MTTTQAVAMAVVRVLALRPRAVALTPARTRVTVATPEAALRAAALISQALTAATPEAVKESELTSCNL